MGQFKDPVNRIKRFKIVQAHNIVFELEKYKKFTGLNTSFNIENVLPYNSEQKFLTGGDFDQDISGMAQNTISMSCKLSVILKLFSTSF